jgi:RHS repeat-associated protein
MEAFLGVGTATKLVGSRTSFVLAREPKARVFVGSAYRRIRAAAAAMVVASGLFAGPALADTVNSTRISLPKGPGSMEGLATPDFAPSLASGTASYEVPISVPPGSAGFGPHLSLAYDSGGGATEVGIGWRIAGAPKIRRRTENGLPVFDDTDAFEIVGLGIPCDLLEVAPSVFRPEYEDGSFVRATRGGGGDVWEARTKSGLTFRFGGDGFTEFEGGHTSGYLLREELDRHGHRIAYEWDPSEGHALLTRVVWNDFDDSSRNEVLFHYESRPDPHRRFSAGILETITRRLRDVEVRHGGRLVRRLDLAYESGAHPVLASMTLVGSDGFTTLPAARFEYTEARLSATAEQVVTMTNAPGRSPASKDTALADLDGDGLPDLLVGQAGQYRTYTNHDGNRWLPGQDWAPGDSPSVSLGTIGAKLADLDADGAPDLVVKSGDSFRYFPRPSGVRFDAPVSIPTVPSFSFEDPDVRLADLDGDRRTDVIVTTPSGIAIGYNRGGRDFTEPAIVGSVGAGQELRFSDGHTDLCDVNGDRVIDLCYLRSEGLTYFLGRGRGRFEPGEEAMGVPAFDASAPFRLEDLNGDGWVDLVRVDVNRVSYALAVSEGGFGPVQSIEGTPTRGVSTSIQFADMNGSGTIDIVWVDVTGADIASWRYLELFPDGRAGLLRRIDNGLGKVQTIEYEPAALGAARARDAGVPWTTRMNVPMPVPRRVEVDDSLGDPRRVQEFSYRDGTYDPRERTFAGFGGATEREIGDAFTPTLVTDTTYDTGLVSRAERGLERIREQRTESGSVFGRISVDYASRTLESAMDGRVVEYAPKASELVEHVEGDPASARRTLTEFVTDQYGNIVEERRWGEVRDGDVLAGNDESIVTRTFANDPAEWLLGFVATESTADGTGARVAQSRRYYDGAPFEGLALGQVTRGDVSREEAWVGPAEDAFELVLATKYDADGNPVETRDARGGGHVFEWAGDHTSIRAERVELGGGRELVETAEVDGAFGNVLAVREYNGSETRYEYDALGRLTKVVRPGDRADAPTTAYAYALGAPLSRVTTDARVGPGEFEHSETLYDGSGRTRGTLTRDGDRWVLAGVSQFDARGNARRSLLPRWVDDAARTEPPLLDDAPPGTDTFHDATSRVVRTRSPSGIESRTEYFALGVRHWDGGQNDPASSYEHTPVVARVDGLNRTVAHVRTLDGATLSATYAYDAAGNLLSRTDPQGAVATYRYDGRGRRVAVMDPDLGVHRFSYDATGNLIGHTYPDGKVARFTFDLAGRSLSEDHDGDGTPEVTRQWDSAPDDPQGPLALGKLVRITGPSGETRHEYDERGRIRRTVLVIGGATYSVGSEFDDRDREILHVYPDGSSIEIHRNARGQIDRYGHAVSIDYGEDGLELERRFNTGVKATSGYDADRRRNELHLTAADGATIEHLRWSYDGGGNLVSAADERAGVSPAEDRTESYAYDNLYRLVGASGTWGTEAWRYSASGNLEGRTSSLAARTVDDVTYGAAPHAPSSFDGRRISYDARARMTGDGVRQYTWTDADELAVVSDEDGSVHSTYDGDGARRIRVEHRADGTDVTTHFIDPWSEVKNGQLVRYIVHGGQRIVRLADDNGTSGEHHAAFPPLDRGSSPGGFEPDGADRSARRGRPADDLLCALNPSSVLAAILLVALVASVGRCAARLRRRSRVFRPTPLGGGIRAATVLIGASLAVLACSHDARPRRGSPPRGSVEELTKADTLLATDLLGSLLAETDGSGNVHGRFSAYPFGAARFDTSDESQKYAGAPRDGAVGLDAMGARFYAPDLGVWTSGDPLAVTAPEHFVTEDFAAANPYAYAKDSPLLAADRDGHFWHIAIGAAVGALMGGAIEAGHQYLATGRVEDWGRVGAAAAGGAVSGAILAANPVAAVGSVMAMGGVSGAAAGITERLVASGGQSAGTVKEAVIDATIGAATAGVLKGGGALVNAAIRRAPGVARALGKVVGALGRGRVPLLRRGYPRRDARRPSSNRSATDRRLRRFARRGHG